MWLYFIRTTRRPRHMCIATNLQIVLNTQKTNPAKKMLAKIILLPLKITETKILNPKKSFDHLRHLESAVSPSPSPRKMSKIVTQSVWIKWTVAICIPYILFKKVITLKSCCLLVSFLNCCLIYVLLVVHLCNIYGDHETHTALCLKWVMIFFNFTYCR